MMRASLAAMLVVALSVAGCTDKVHGERSTQEEAVRLHQLFEEHFEESLRLNPLYATFIGDHRYNDRFANTIGPEHRAAADALDRRFLDAVRAVDRTQLGEQDGLSYDMFVSDRERALASREFPSHLIPINQFYSMPSTFVQLGSGMGAQPFETVEDYEAFLSRIDGFLEWTAQAEANFREGAERSVVLPRLLVERTLPQLAAHVVEDAEDSLFWGPVANMPDEIADDERARLTAAYREAIMDRLVPAYARLHDFLQDEYMPHARDSYGMGGLPGGEDWYAFLVRNTTTTDLTPDEIHQIGLAEVARIHEEMRGVMDEVGFDGTLHEFFRFTETDPQFFFEDGEQLVQGYRDLQDTVDPLLPRLFDVFPEANYEVRAVEAFRERSAAGASYMRPAPDGSRPGIFYVNTYDIKSRPNWAMESLSLHEASPGHHFQISIQQELEGLPRFRRFGGNTAYVEGWALYAETLGRELGVYTDPYQYYGALAGELWRAIRLVVDTGLHHYGWSRQEVLDYMSDNSAAPPARKVAEAERYMAIPSQALAYKIGQMKIRELRDRAEATLGDDFDVRAFHAEILKDGALPLDILEAKVDRWIADHG